ncbi:MAG: ABC transporter ATP-binding protein [Tissierellia bacterium]|jgi:ATP-binding cassette subfamily B protein|nr:ABC transporter ATP-binding protein [Tissierellia bacterium]MDD3226492.1 ABC transporter ATP-binding protein [Tissierellia bacterium]MDD3751412.1 ABC transporter ATP-binding protein [Tissierellia bacterium]MDD4046740.1 ABC transporter ATP-binding protein [Tissierellia bacterium]MDD4679199.1 ABC transporter ATP-binding protein [Tissierellia bacterium]
MNYYEEESYSSFNIKPWLKLGRFFKPYTKKLLGIVLFMFLTALMDLSIPLFQKYAVDSFIAKDTTEGINSFIALYGAALVTMAISVTIFIRLAVEVEMHIGMDLRKEIFEHLQNLSLSYYNKTPVGYILARTLSDTNKIGSMIAWGLVDVFWSFVYVIGAFIAMFMLNVKLTLIVSLVIPVMAVITFYFQNKILLTSRKLRKVNSKMTGSFNEGITGAKTSKSLVIEDKNLMEFKNISSEMKLSAVRLARLNALYIPIIVFFGSVLTALVLAKGGRLAMEQIIQIGTLSAFLSYAINIFEPVQQLARTFAEVISLQANIERVTELLEKEPLIKDREDVVKIYGDNINPKRENWEEIAGEIEFKNVTFKYPDGDEEVLQNFNLHIPAGANVAIVGETGAGKSTLVNLACRFFEPTEGEILIDDKDYRERSQLWLHSNIGYVLQDPHLFSGTIKENIRYGNLDATDEDIMEAAKIVSVDSIINKLEKGYDSHVGEGGDRLSTGEKQLISIARAILANPKIFILDEATSSVDTHTERLIQKGIEYLLKGRTSFIIAHRLSTIKKADIILVVNDGKIIERGTHKDLIAKKGHYYSLYTKQFEEEKTFEVLQ